MIIYNKDVIRNGTTPSLASSSSSFEISLQANEDINKKEKKRTQETTKNKKKKKTRRIIRKKKLTKNNREFLERLGLKI